MPRIAVALGVLASVAFCIGFNTVRYPVVWEMLQQPGLPVFASQPADAPSPAALATKPPQPAAKSTPSTGSASKTSAKSGRRAFAAASQAESEPEFCTADGVCQIAAGPQPTTLKGSTPAPKSGADLAASLPGLPRDASLDGLKDRVERRLVPVPDGPPVSSLRSLPPVDESAAAASGPAVPQPAGASTPFYPTSGYPAVDLARFKSGKPGNLVPVSQPGS